jgi:hypothetical protein
VPFFKGLQADNTKACWSARKAFYETSVRESMAALLDELRGLPALPCRRQPAAVLTACWGAAGFGAVGGVRLMVSSRTARW